MNNATLERPVTETVMGELKHIPESIDSNSLPSEVFGINTVALLEFGKVAVDSTLLSAGMEKNLRLLPQAIKFMPLIETLQANRNATHDDLEPYRQIVREVSKPVALAEKVASHLGSRVARALDRKIDTKIVDKTREATVNSHEKLQEYSDDIAHVLSFPNPNVQFSGEVSLLSQTMGQAIRNERNKRVAGITVVPQNSVPGFKGFLIKTVQKVKGFFRRLFGGQQKQAEVTAYDAGAGIESVVQSFKQQPEAMDKKYPLLNRFVQKVLPKTQRFYSDYYAVAAPEILNFVYSGAHPSAKDTELLASVQRNPSDLRFVTNYGRLHERLGKIQTASHDLLPALSNILPSDSTQMAATFANIQAFFAPKSAIEPVVVLEDAQESEVKDIPQQKRLKRLLSKLKRTNKT